MSHDADVSPSLKYKIHTYGCKVNSYDSGLIQSRLVDGFAYDDENAHVHILNTCAVTAEATKEAVRHIRRIKAKDPFAKVVVTGCAAQVDTDSFSGLPGADLVVANSHKGRLGELIQGHYNGTVRDKVFKSNIFRKDDLEAGGGRERAHTRSFLKIQDGCNSFCTYCVIPFGRGKSRSLTINQLLRRIHELEAEGMQEVVLTGVHIGDYEDGDKRLEDLVEAVLKKTSVQRIRMTSLEPPEVSERMLDLYSDERLCPHFHMSIQSANTVVLEKMKRQYTARDVEHSLNEIARRVPDVFVGMDVIVGFPQESEDEFEDTYQRLAALPWTRIHVFPYSSRPGTRAEKMEGHLYPHMIKERSKRLRALSSERYAKKALEQIGRTELALVLQSEKNGRRLALTRNYWNVQVEGEVQPGFEVPIQITGFDRSENSRMDGLLLGEPVSPQ